jgi:membrane associated rhomboid family serine protease
MAYQEYRPSSFNALPLVIKNILIINVLVFIATLVFQHTLQIDLSDYLALHNFRSSLFRPFQFVTYMFMHATTDNFGNFNFMHIFFNMFALWMFGNVLENMWGPKKFLIFYMVTGIGAGLIYLGYEAFQSHQIQVALQELTNLPTPEKYMSILHRHFYNFVEIPENRSQIDGFVAAWTQHPNDPSFLARAISDIRQLGEFKMNTPMLGASGAVFGVLLAYGMSFPDSLIYIYFLIPLKAKYFVIIYGLIEFYLGVKNDPADNVAHFAHLGGMLFGFFLIKYWQRRRNKFY